MAKPLSLRNQEWRAVFEVSTRLAMIALAAILAWQRWLELSRSAPGQLRNRVEIPQDPITVSGKPMLGASTAKVAIVEYSDFQCPYCAAIARDTLPVVMREYVNTGR